MSQAATPPLAPAIHGALCALADPRRAKAMAAYMRHIQPFLGVGSPQLKQVVAQQWAAHPIPQDFGQGWAVLEALYRSPWRESRYAALELAKKWRWMWEPQFLDGLEWMIVEGGWWDLVDTLAAHPVGGILERHPETAARIFGYIHHPNLWLRRTALLCQLRRKQATDAGALAQAVLTVAHEREFFIRKAIGWALRDYAKVNGEWVKNFVEANREQLSPLSRREALKHLGGDKPAR